MVDGELTAYLSGGIERLVKDALAASWHNPREAAYLLRYTLAARRAGRKRVRMEKQGAAVPPFLIASITSSCNLQCKGCYARANHICSDSAAKPFLSTERNLFMPGGEPGSFRDTKPLLSEKRNRFLPGGEIGSSQNVKPLLSEKRNRFLPGGETVSSQNVKTLLSEKRWDELFCEAQTIGVSFILLAGGEPLLRREVIQKAARHKDILFPVFTNGTVLDDELLRLFHKNRNLVPVLSVEGDAACSGVYDKLTKMMAAFAQKGMLFGASVTVTTENIAAVTSDAFLQELKQNGCRIVFYVEYVPADGKSEHLAPTDTEREQLESRLCTLRADGGEMLYLSFPGDEKSTGGCLAAGRGFFHINPYGAAEPCPFSPYSDSSVAEGSLLDALKSPLFAGLKENGLVGGEHIGGCALFLHEQEVKALCKQGATGDNGLRHNE